jgi:hypothetical protein
VIVEINAQKCNSIKFRKRWKITKGFQNSFINKPPAKSSDWLVAKQTREQVSKAMISSRVQTNTEIVQKDLNHK